MLFDYTINEMTTDELRNYAHHMNEIEEKYGELVYALQDGNEMLQRLYNNADYCHNCILHLNICRDNFVRFEDEIRAKYKYAEPKIGKVNDAEIH